MKLASNGHLNICGEQPLSGTTTLERLTRNRRSCNPVSERGHGHIPAPHFVQLAGNTRAYRLAHPPMRPYPWTLSRNFGVYNMHEAVCDYRLPPLVHDLFVNDLHRRFFQRLHRRSLRDPACPSYQHNCDNKEIYSGSPSYLDQRQKPSQ
jgi:hypothetical protein